MPRPRAGKPADIVHALEPTPHDRDPLAVALNERFTELGGDHPVIHRRRRTERVTDTTRDARANNDGRIALGVTRADPDSLAEAYQEHGGRVHAYALAICGTRDAETIVHSVFLGWWQSPELFEADGRSLRSFLLLETHRHLSNARPADLEAAPDRSVGTQPLLLGLPAHERDAIALTYFGGYTYREVANLLDEPPGTITSRITRGLSRLSAG